VPVPPASVLAGIADAVRLTTDECNHMYTLAGQARALAFGLAVV
jgi:hypothetical protein